MWTVLRVIQDEFLSYYIFMEKKQEIACYFDPSRVCHQGLFNNTTKMYGNFTYGNFYVKPLKLCDKEGTHNKSPLCNCKMNRPIIK